MVTAHKRNALCLTSADGDRRLLHVCDGFCSGAADFFAEFPIVSLVPLEEASDFADNRCGMGVDAGKKHRFKWKTNVGRHLCPDLVGVPLQNLGNVQTDGQGGVGAVTEGQGCYVQRFNHMVGVSFPIIAVEHGTQGGCDVDLCNASFHRNGLLSVLCQKYTTIPYGFLYLKFLRCTERAKAAHTGSVFFAEIHRKSPFSIVSESIAVVCFFDCSINPWEKQALFYVVVHLLLCEKKQGIRQWIPCFIWVD